MPYIIDQAQMIKGDSLVTCSLLIKNDRIDFIKESFDKLPYMKMNLSQFLITPGHVMMDMSFSPNMTFPQFKEYFQEKYLQKGCTTVLFICDVKYEREIVYKLNLYRHALLNCPVDFYLGIKIPIRALTPSLILRCKKLKIPVIFVEIEHEIQLDRVQWGWIREAVYGYFLPLVPVWKINENSKSVYRRYNERWSQLTNEHHVPAIPYCLDESLPLDKNVLKKIGIYPLKGEIRIGGEVDYNLYDKHEIINKVAQINDVDYHSHIPKITVHKNKIIKEGNRILFRPGYGNECIVKVPGYFKAYFDD